jgi:hypothetical protein
MTVMRNKGLEILASMARQAEMDNQQKRAMAMQDEHSRQQQAQQQAQVDLRAMRERRQQINQFQGRRGGFL